MMRWVAIGIVALISLGLGAGFGVLIHHPLVGVGLGAVLAVGLAAAIGVPLEQLRWDRREDSGGVPPMD